MCPESHLIEHRLTAISDTVHAAASDGHGPARHARTVSDVVRHAWRANLKVDAGKGTKYSRPF